MPMCWAASLIGEVLSSTLRSSWEIWEQQWSASCVLTKLIRRRLSVCYDTSRKGEPGTLLSGRGYYTSSTHPDTEVSWTWKGTCNRPATGASTSTKSLDVACLAHPSSGGSTRSARVRSTALNYFPEDTDDLRPPYNCPSKTIRGYPRALNKFAMLQSKSDGRAEISLIFVDTMRFLLALASPWHAWLRSVKDVLRDVTFDQVKSDSRSTEHSSSSIMV